MFNDVFVKLLQERNISSYKLTKDTGIDNGLISKWKNGINLPSVDMLIRLADYFDVSADYLLGRTDKPETNK
jgi:repressor LexA